MEFRVGEWSCRAQLAVERKSERADTAYSPRFREEELPATANEQVGRRPRFREEEPSATANLLQQIANSKRNGLCDSLMAGRRRMQTISFCVAEIRIVRARDRIKP